jgi:hypothetical protein
MELDDLLDQLHEEHGIDPSSTQIPLDAPLTNPTDVVRPAQAAAAVIESTGGADFDPEFAAFGPRLIGWLIDTTVMLILMTPGVAVIVAGSSIPSTVIGIALAVAGFLVATVLYARSVTRTGKWIGNRITHTEVVDVLNGSRLDHGRSSTRFVIRQLVSPIFFFGFLMALGDGQRRGFHDQMASSIVVRPPRQTWSIDDEG